MILVENYKLKNTAYMKFFKNSTSMILILVLCIMSFFFISNTKKSSQLKVQTISENIGGKNFSLEIASDDQSRQLGLGKRDSLGEDQGMVFVFDKPDKYGFWMKDTRFPLDIIWLNENCMVVGKAQMFPESFPKVFYPDFPALYAIELPLNSVQGVKGGDKLMTCKFR